MSSASYNIERLRKEWLGRSGPRVKAHYSVEHEPIRRWCHMLDDLNPLFLDPAYGRRSKYKGTIAPPATIDLFADLRPWPPPPDAQLYMQVPTPGARATNLTREIEWFRPLKVGDHLTSVSRVADLYERAIKADPKAVWIVTETTFTNQRRQKVAVMRSLLLKYRGPEEIARDNAAGK